MSAISATNCGLVFVGAGLGGVARFIAGAAIQASASRLALLHQFPVGTLAVNVTGCLAMGVLMGWWSLSGSQSPPTGREEWKVLILVGVLGGYTTFSSFGRDFLELMHAGNTSRACAYVTLSVVLSLLAVWLGHAAGILLRS